jgi:hypothetical protein
MHLSRINKLNATILDIPNLYVHVMLQRDLNFCKNIKIIKV